MNNVQLIILLFFSISFGQKKATTEDGKIVILNENGTWQYQQVEQKSNDKGSLGGWEINYFVDDFGDPTSNGYITTDKYIFGKFSNSATTNSELKVNFLIDIDNVSIKLYEYGGRTEVKGSISPIDYKLLIKHNGERVNTEFILRNYSNRANMKETQMNEFLDLLKQGGQFQFVLDERGKYSNGTYKFKIDDASGFDNAWNQLYGDTESDIR